MSDNDIKEPVSSDAVRYFHEAIDAEKHGDLTRAYQLLLASVTEDPSLPGAWNNFGLLLQKMRHYKSAVGAFHKALSLAPDAPLTRLNYAWALHLAGRHDEALTKFPEETDTWRYSTNDIVNLSQLSLTCGKILPALVIAKDATLRDPASAHAKLALALAQLRSGDYVSGLKNYEARLDVNPVLSQMRGYPMPLWGGEDISTKRLYIVCEQGIGDAVMFMRFIPEAAKRARKVIIQVHAECLKLYKRNLKSPNIEINAAPCPLPPADVYCPILSLPVALGLTDEEMAKSWYRYKYTGASLFYPKTKAKKIGICWAGDPHHDNDRYRSALLTDFYPLLETQNTQYYSLQVGPRQLDLDNNGAHGMIVNLAPLIRDVNDTCEIISQLDAVITVDTSLAHIAGSMGVKTLLLLAPNSIDWRWGCGDGVTPWYPTMMLVNHGGEGFEKLIREGLAQGGLA